MKLFILIMLFCVSLMGQDYTRLLMIQMNDGNIFNGYITSHDSTQIYFENYLSTKKSILQKKDILSIKTSKDDITDEFLSPLQMIIVQMKLKYNLEKSVEKLADAAMIYAKAINLMAIIFAIEFGLMILFILLF